MCIPFHDDCSACRTPRAEEHVANDKLAPVAWVADADNSLRMVLVLETLSSSEDDRLCLADQPRSDRNVQCIVNDVNAVRDWVSQTTYQK